MMKKLPVFLLFLSGVALSQDPKKEVDKDEGFVTTSKTSHDFSETLIEGKIKAPKGFYLQGKQGQSLSQLVKLRENFRHELRSTRDSVQSAVK